MSIEKHRDSHESLPHKELVVPAIESLLAPSKEKNAWPREVRDNEGLRQQAEERQVLCKHLDTIYSHVPRADMELSDAVASDLIDEKNVAHTYESLSNLLEKDTDAARLALYMPFEMLPARTWKPRSEVLQKAADRFAQAYMRRWRELLQVRDVRANFVDGDVLEVSQRTQDLPRVVKAAHLLPKLVEKQFISSREVIDLMAHSPMDTLRDSIADAISVLADMKLLSEEDLDHMSRSDDPLTRNMSRIIAADREASRLGSTKTALSIDLSNVSSALTARFADIDAHSTDGVTSARYEWLKQEERRRSVEHYARAIASAISDATLKPDEVAHMIDDADSPAALALIHGIRTSMETIAATDQDRAHSLYQTYEPILTDLWTRGSSATQDSLTSTFSRLGSLGLVSKPKLEKLGIIIPELGSPLSLHAARMHEEVRDITAITKSIESSPRLAQMVYPVSLLFGSRLKGYGARTADIDVAIFVRPGTPLSDRSELQSLLKETFAHEKIQGKVVEFWLEERGDTLAVRDLPDAGPALGESSWTHILFGAAWCGDQKAIKELHEKLLAPYLYAADSMIGGRSERSMWLEEMERDFLQYRLMHKGYARFFPEQGGIHTPHSDAIDADSAFWDSGYRRVATKIFASRVFLPHIEKGHETK